MNIAADHRPWPVPARPWRMKQRWHDLLFAHWPISPDAMREKVPAPLELDLFGGEAWLGVVPFRMSGVRWRGWPPLPGFSAFPELNVRTYVTHGGKPGVYFFSLDAASRVAVEVARRWYCLPYFHARMSLRERGSEIHYTSIRTDARGEWAELRARYAPRGDAAPATPGSLDYFLTERYCLYTHGRDARLLRGEILHAPWPLQPAAAEMEKNSMAAAAGFRLPDAEPVLHFARQLDVLIWPLAPASSFSRA